MTLDYYLPVINIKKTLLIFCNQFKFIEQNTLNICSIKNINRKIRMIRIKISHSILLLSFFISLTACSKTDLNLKSVSAEDFKQAITDKAVILIDVRTEAEYADGHIANAINIDVNSSDFSNQVNLVLKPEKSLAIYCLSGRRSKLAASKLELPTTIIYELNNGFNDWTQSGFPITN